MIVSLCSRADLELLVCREASCAAVADDFASGRYKPEKLLHYFQVNGILNAMFPTPFSTPCYPLHNGLSGSQSLDKWFAQREAALPHAAQIAAGFYEQDPQMLLHDYQTVSAVRKTHAVTIPVARQPEHNPEGQSYQAH
ncbi:hypothetical protein HYW21_07085 [Candidatus Woesearchaeota archaeon]|nr:hypothetical protein [Candidatus Woesearchaeota archaeon]